jgi:hypothetical protein
MGPMIGVMVCKETLMAHQCQAMTDFDLRFAECFGSITTNLCEK